MKIGILGFGSMGKTHAYSIANLKYFYSPLPFKAEVAGITTRNPARTAELVEQYGVGKVYLDEDDMINDPEIDVIDICTPNIAHYETLKKAIAAGKNIYCEKPLCVTAAEAKEIAELAREKGIIGGIVFNTRFLLPVMRAKELIDAGRPLDALPILERIPQSKTAQKRLDAYVYRIIGRWKDTKGREFTFRRDGTCRIDGKELYFGGSSYYVFVGEQPYPTKLVYNVVSLKRGVLSLRDEETNKNFRLTYLGEPLPAEEAEQEETHSTTEVQS